jgi:hypothetical protein
MTLMRSVMNYVQDNDDDVIIFSFCHNSSIEGHTSLRLRQLQWSRTFRPAANQRWSSSRRLQKMHYKLKYRNMYNKTLYKNTARNTHIFTWSHAHTL